MIHLEFSALLLGQKRAFPEVSVDILGQFLYNIIIDERVNIDIFLICISIRAMQRSLKIVEKLPGLVKLVRGRYLRLGKHHRHTHACPPYGLLVHTLFYFKIEIVFLVDINPVL